MVDIDRSHQAAELARGLATLPGGKALNIRGKRFPRNLPAESGSGYQQEERCLAVEDIAAAAAPIPLGMDELELTLEGELNGEAAADSIVLRLRELFSDETVSTNWDVRSRVPRDGGKSQHYEVTLSTGTPAYYPA